MESTSSTSADMLAAISSTYSDAHRILATMSALAEQARKSGSERADLSDCVATQREQILAFKTNIALADRKILEHQSELRSVEGKCAALRSREAALEQKCEQLEKANANLRTMASQRQEEKQLAKQEAAKQIAALIEENNRLRSQFPSPDRKKQDQLLATLQTSLRDAQQVVAGQEKELSVAQQERDEAMEHSKNALTKLSACENQLTSLKTGLKTVETKRDELKTEWTELKSSLNNTQQLLNEAKEENANLRDSEAIALRKADEFETELASCRGLLDVAKQDFDQKTDDYHEELNELDAKKDDAIKRVAALEKQRELERLLTVARDTELRNENLSLQMAVHQSALTVAALRKEALQQRKVVVQGTRRRYFGTHEISERFDELFADKVFHLYDRIDDLVVSYKGQELPRGFGRPAIRRQTYELQDLGSVEEAVVDVECTDLGKRPWALRKHGAPYDGPLVDGTFTRRTHPDAATVATLGGERHFSRTDMDFRAPVARMTIERPETPQSDITEHGRLQMILSSGCAQTLTPSPTDEASQSPLFEPECAASETIAKEDQPKEDLPNDDQPKDELLIKVPEPTRPQKRGIVFNPPPRPKRTRYEGPDDPRLRAPKQPRGDRFASRACYSSTRGDSYDSYRPSYG